MFAPHLPPAHLRLPFRYYARNSIYLMMWQGLLSWQRGPQARRCSPVWFLSLWPNLLSVLGPSLAPRYSTISASVLGYPPPPFSLSISIFPCDLSFWVRSVLYSTEGKLFLDWRILLRECFFYFVALILLIWALKVFFSLLLPLSPKWSLIFIWNRDLCTMLWYTLQKTTPMPLSRSTGNRFSPPPPPLIHLIIVSSSPSSWC